MLPQPSRRLPWKSEQDIELLREHARRYIEGEIAPQLAGWRAAGRSDPAAWRAFGAMGLLLPELPEPYGGAGATLAHQVVIQEELARAEVTTGTATVHAIAAHYILDHGTEAQKQRWLPAMARGELLAAIAMTEPGAGSDLQALRTRATPDGEGGWRISGSKTFITGGANAGLILVVCRSGSERGGRGLSLFGVETRELPGFRVGRLLDKLGMKASDTAELFFDEVRVPGDALIGGVEGQGFVQMMKQLPFERMLAGAMAVTAIERAVELTVAYTKERQAFGQAVYDFQNTRFTLADCASTAHVLRCFFDDCVQRLVDGELDATAACMAKLWCSEQQCRVLDACLQLFGGNGYMNEYPIARMYADARVQKIYGGTNEIMKELIARSL